MHRIDILAIKIKIFINWNHYNVPELGFQYFPEWNGINIKWKKNWPYISKMKKNSLREIVF